MSVLEAPVIPSQENYAHLRSLVASWQLLMETRKKIILPLKRAVSDEETPRLLPWMVDAIAPIEEEKALTEKDIVRVWKQHPLYPWQVEIRGLGEHSCAVAVALMGGDPYVAYPIRRVGPKKSSRWIAEEPYIRTLGQLRSYCGLGDPQRKRTENMSQEDLLGLGKPLLKARLRLISESFLKAQDDIYAPIYYEARDRYEDAIHAWNCRGRGTCGLDSGTPWRDGHKHAASLRLVAKAFLADLYDESKRLHEEGEWC